MRGVGMGQISSGGACGRACSTTKTRVPCDVVVAERRFNNSARLCSGLGRRKATQTDGWGCPRFPPPAMRSTLKAVVAATLATMRGNGNLHPGKASGKAPVARQAAYGRGR